MTTYVIRSITPNSVTVDFDDGTWAEVPVERSMDRDFILATISAYHPAGTQTNLASPFDAAEDIPVQVGEELEVMNFEQQLAAKSESTLDTNVDWNKARNHFYPDAMEMLKTMCSVLAENGNTQCEEYLSYMSQIDERFPIGWTTSKNSWEQLIGVGE